MKKFLLLIFFAVLYYGCSSTFDTSNLKPDERLKYAMELYGEESFDKAIQEFEAILLQYPGNEVIDDAQFYLGKSRFNRKEYILAAFEFSKLIRNMPASNFVSEAQFNLAECYYKLSPHFSLDPKYTKKAIEEFQAFLDFFPADLKVPEAEMKIKEMNEKLAMKEFNSAYIYHKLEYYTSTLMYLDNVISTFHDTQFAPKASYKKINVLLEKERTIDALIEINNFLAKYPTDNNYNEVLQLKDKLEKKISLDKKD